MANGDVTHVKELGRSRVEGGGSTLGGISKNNKVLVWGEISASYAATGIAMNGVGGVRALGLTTLDFIQLEVKGAGAAGTTEPADDALFLANYKRTTDKIFVVDQVGASDPAVPTAGDLLVISYFASGESASAPDLV